MKILVIDDTKKHLDAALQTLVGHDVTICSSHDKASELLYRKTDYDLYHRLYDEYKAAGDPDARTKARAESMLPYWDVVLCDLLMPAGSNAQGGVGLQYVGQEMPVGWSLALTAAQSGAKFVAVVTDMNHHHHPASAMLDSFNRHFFNIDGAKVLMTNYVDMVGITGTECTCDKCNGSGKDGDYKCYRCDGTGTDFAVKGKDWSEILQQLLGQNDEE